MRKQILVLLSALGLAVSTAPASAQQPTGEKANHRIKWSKTDGMSNTWKTSSRHKVAQASGKRIESGLTTKGIPPGPNVSSTGGSGAGKVDTLSRPKLTLNPQPLPPGVHTLNPQPLPPGVHTNVGGQGLSASKKLTLNPQPLPPGVRPSRDKKQK